MSSKRGPAFGDIHRTTMFYGRKILCLSTLSFRYLGIVYAEQLTTAEPLPAHGVGDQKLSIMS